MNTNDRKFINKYGYMAFECVKAQKKWKFPMRIVAYALHLQVWTCYRLKRKYDLQKDLDQK